MADEMDEDKEAARKAPPPMPTSRWDRQLEESPQAFEAFSAYLDMGPTRTLRRAASKLCKSTTLLERWSLVHEWRTRAGHFDREMDRIRRENHRKQLDQMSDRHARIAKAMSGKLIEWLKTYDAGELTARDAALWLKTIVEIERHSLGERLVNRARRGRPFHDDDEEPRDGRTGQYKPKPVPQPQAAPAGQADETTQH